MKHFYTTTLSAVILLFTTTCMAQVNIFMENGTVSTCNASFQDDNSGGAEGAPYSNTDYVFTICPDNPGDVIQASFVAFNLQTSPNPNNSDWLTIYDGDSTGANSLGSYTSDDLTGIPVTGTVDNVSGCLTFQFSVNTGNTNGLPGWEALITCTTPCASPTSEAIFVDPEPDDPQVQTVGVCLGQEVIFGDNGSSAQPGFTLDSWIWSFDDGTTGTNNGGNIVHTYDEPGEYIVTLNVVDNNGCYSLNLQPLQVLVSTIPIFNTEYQNPICLGGVGQADGNPVQNVTWTALPPQVVSGETYLADGAGFSFTSELTFDFFDADAVLEDCDDLYTVFINMEHSYLGDLGMFIECPDGTSVTILDWGLNGGGGTFLGEAVDDGSTIPGTGWDYGWQPGNTNGNLDDGNSSQYSYVDNAGNNWNNAAIVDPGYYESDGDLCDLVGCPLNGTWTFNVTDNLAIDNGYIFSWGMEFNPSLYPDITTFTPVVGLGADSSWWEGPYIVDVSADGNVISFEPPALGFYDYTYVVTNNFGCQLDTTVTVEVVNGPVVDAGMDMTFCGDLQLGATIVSNELPMPPCQFTLSMYNVNGDFLGWDGGSVDVTVDGVYVGNYTTWGGTVDQPISINTGSSLEIYFYPSLWGGDDGAEFQILDDDGNAIYTSPTGPAEGLLFDEVITCVGPGQIVYEWSPSGGLSDGGVPNPFVEQVSGSTEFTVTAYPSDFPGCVTTDVVTIEPAFDFDVTSQSPSCAGNDGWVQVVVDGGSGTPPWTIEFYQNGALQSSTDTNGGTENFNDLLPGDYMVSIINNQCTYDIDAELDEPGILIVELSPDTTICVGGVAALHASSPQDPDGSWTYFWDNGAGSGSTVYVDPDVATTYEVYAIDDFGCESAAFTVDVDIFDPLSLTAEGDIFICEDAETDLGVMDSDGGMGTPYTYTWTFNGQQIGTGYTLSYQPQQSGSYCVTITDQCESPAVQDCIDVTVEDPIVVQLESDTTKGCFPADIVFNVGNDPSTYSLASWQFSDGGFELNASQLDHTFDLPGVYDVELTLVSPAGCVYEGWFENYITVYSNPTAGYHASPQPTTAPETTIDFFDYSLGSVVEWYWTFDSINNLGESFEQNPRFEFPIDHGGLYPVTLMVTDANGCVDRVTRWIEIHDIFNVFIPNTFTPNSDGFNDVLFVQGTDIDPNRFKFTVFDRWGEEVFETTDPSIAWTGSFQGGDHYTPDGMYIWHLIVYSISTAERHEITGHVNMIR